jgi:hypothetical protein
MYMLRDGASPLDAARPYAWLPSWLSERVHVRRRIEAAVGRQVGGYFSLYEVPTRLLPRFDLVERRSIFAPGGLRRGRSIFDRLVELQLRTTTYTWRTPEEQNLQDAEADLVSGGVDFVFLYLPALDSLLHAQGSGGEAVAQHLRWYEQRLRRLLERAHDTAEHVEFALFSDHGMSNVHGSVDLIPDVEGAVGRNGDRYLAFYDSTMARFWVKDAPTRDRLVELLARRSGGRVLPDDELGQLGVRFDDRSQGDLVFALKEGLILLPSYMGRTMLAGMHGYHPDSRGADACVLGLHAPDTTLTHMRDLYGLMDAAARRLAEERA